MNTPHSDVLVHVTDALEDSARDRLLERLGAEQGIRSVRAGARAGQLLLIDYDRRAISALGILRCVQAQGYAARLVGM
ncbi:MAG TPA: hypothetical protein VEH51_15355 [Burkholderiales bacterium]|nr:hypothetical protein [Burkholderiales bacterium]